MRVGIDFGGTNFKLGDFVRKGQILVRMSDAATTAKLITARSSYAEAEEAFSLADSNAKTSIKQSEITLADSYTTAVRLANQALVKVFSALNEVDDIIVIDNDLDNVYAPDGLGAANSVSIIEAKNSYQKSEYAYANTLNTFESLDDSDRKAIEKSLLEVREVLDLTLDTLRATRVVLDASVTGESFPVVALAIYKSAISAQETFINVELNSIKVSQQGISDKITELAKSSQLQGAELAQAAAKYTSDSAVSKARSTLITAEGGLTVAQSEAENLFIRAPFSGYVTAKTAEVGDRVTSATALGTVSVLDSLKVSLQIFPNDINRIDLDASVEVDGAHIGYVSSISPAADPVTRQIPLEIALDNTDGNINSEVLARVKFKASAGTEEQVDDLSYNTNSPAIIPLNAVHVTTGGNYVWIAAGNDTAVRRIVILGSLDGSNVNIESGLNIGDRIIVKGNRNIIDEGQAIEVVNVVK